MTKTTKGIFMGWRWRRAHTSRSQTEHRERERAGEVKEGCCRWGPHVSEWCVGRCGRGALVG